MSHSYPINTMSAAEKRALLAKILREMAEAPAIDYPLSYGQSALWLIQQLAPESAAYHVNLAGRIRAKLDIPALRRAFQRLVDRHASLRTTFPVRDGNPIQRVHKQMDVHFVEMDASAGDMDTLLDRLVQEAHSPFDLRERPLMRVNLFTRSPQDHVLSVTAHHIILDGVSIAILLDELRVLYPAERKGTAASLPPRRIQYADFVRWQSEMQPGADGQEHLAYWQKQLADPLPVLNLPQARSRPPVQTHHGASCLFRLDRDLTSRIKQLATSRLATVYTALLATFQALLFRYSGQEDILIGSPTVSRHKAEFEGVVGYFINPVVIRANLSSDPSFKELLDRVRHTVLDALQHQDYPFPLLVEQLQPARDLSRSPLFQVLFNMPKAYRLEEQGVSHLMLGDSGARVDIGGVDWELFGLGQQTSMFDLVLTMVEAEGSICASLQYNTDLFDAADITRMAEHFQTLAQAIVDRPEERVSRLRILTESERRQLLTDWNQTTTDWPRKLCAHQMFHAQVEKSPEAVAAICGDEGLTYRDLDQRANRLARLLMERGVGSETVVALLAERGLDFLAAMLAVFKAGAAYLPLDPRHPPNRLLQILGQSCTPLVLLQRAFAHSITEMLQALPAESRAGVMVIEDAKDSGEHSDFLSPSSGPHSLAYVIYTSGSTGTPKGAMIEHQGMLNHLRAKITQLDLTRADVVAQTASQCFDISVWQFLAPLLVGGTVRIFDDEIARDPIRLFEEADRHKISVLENVPSLLQAVLEEIASRGSRRPDLTALRWLILTGEALGPEMCRQWLGLYPQIPLLNAYGPTECSDDVTHGVVDRPPAEAVTRMPIGRPIANTKIHIMDRNLELVPVGVAGEIFVGGIGVGRGYLNDPARTDEAFIHHSMDSGPSERLYRTGDLGCWTADGSIEFLGRLDHQLKVRGFRIELGEIEAHLKQYPGLRDAVIISVGDIPGQERLAAYCVADKQPLSSRELRRFLVERLPAYMVPGAFVMLDSLPLTPNGKLDRRKLPVPDWGATAAPGNSTPPRNGVETKLRDIWRRTLGVEELGIHDNFFELGGHSLLAVRLLAEIQRAFQVSVPLLSFFEGPTVAQLAQTIQGTGRESSHAPAGKMTLDELLSEAQLDSAIQPPVSSPANGTGLERVFVTGATGFVGAHLVRSLLEHTDAQVYCLVRAADHQAGGARIREAMESYAVWDGDLSDRITPVAGDISRPLLGVSEKVFGELAETIGAIYHSGALVNFFYPYGTLKASNVGGTEEVLRLACHTTAKPLHHISTISVFSSNGASKGHLFREADALETVDHLHDGYSQSKWVAEKLVMTAHSRGLPVRIYRPHWVTGHSRSGICSTDDFVFQLLRACLRLGSAPDLDFPVHMTPVDYVSDAIVHLSKRPATKELAFHLVNPHPARWSEVFDWLQMSGYKLKRIPYEAWIAEVSKSEGPAGEHLRMLVPLLSSRIVEHRTGSSSSHSLALMEVDCQTALSELGGTSVVCPPVDSHMLATYMGYLTRIGFLPPRSGSD